MTEQPQQLKYYNRLIDYDDEEHPIYCFICNDKRKHLNNSIQILPEHITQNIIYFTGCQCCQKTCEMLDLSDEIESLKKQRNKKDARRQLEMKGDRMAQERDIIAEEHDENNFTY